MSSNKKRTATAAGLMTLPPVKGETDLVRIEESVEDFISLRLPHCKAARLEIKPLFTNKKGQSYFRCNYWDQIPGNIVTTNLIMRSHYIMIEKQDGEYVFSDLTVKAANRLI